MERLSGWGRFPVAECEIARPRDEAALRRLVLQGPGIARGNGRSYGDSALHPTNTIAMTGFDRMLAFEAMTGELIVEAGVMLGDIIDAFLPRGWFPSVMPGTKFVTVGGMIAADVHGKNHHKHGSFGSFVEWIDLMDAGGDIVRCSRTEYPALFAATVGGMGLSGVIVRAAIRLKRVESAWIRQMTIPAPSLDDAVEIFERVADWSYSVAWIDCLSDGAAIGRSLVMLGEHALREELDDRRRSAPYRIPARHKRRVLFDLPGFAINRYSIGLFNALYYAGKRRGGSSLVDWDSYFFPLDGVLEWNRLYGQRGFAQFQCVLPLAASREGLKALLSRVARSGQGSFLAVLKRLGAQDSAFSFPMEGFTLALDFPISPRVLALMHELDRVTIDHGGRIYLAKDSRMSAAVLERSDTRVAAFRAQRRLTGAADRFVSLQSQRLCL
jgi:decaprenylphospho-beta-D-ribofuranose 2-oxidase